MSAVDNFINTLAAGIHNAGNAAGNAASTLGKNVNFVANDVNKQVVQPVAHDISNGFLQGLSTAHTAVNNGVNSAGKTLSPLAHDISSFSTNIGLSKALQNFSNLPLNNGMNAINNPVTNTLNPATHLLNFLPHPGTYTLPLIGQKTMPNISVGDAATFGKNAAVATAQQIPRDITSGYLSATGQKTFTPQDTLQKAVMGTEPVKDFGTTSKAVQDFLTTHGLPSGIAGKAALPLVGLSTALDFSGVDSLGKGVVKQGAKVAGKALLEHEATALTTDASKQALSDIATTARKSQTIDEFKQAITDPAQQKLVQDFVKQGGYKTEDEAFSALKDVHNPTLNPIAKYLPSEKPTNAAQLHSQEYMLHNYEQAKADYTARVTKEYGNPNVVSADDAKHIIPGYAGHLAQDFHEAASAFSKALYDEKLAENKGKGNNTVLFTAGGSGSGKTSAIKNVMGDSLTDYPVIFDSTMQSVGSAEKKIQSAVDHGYNVDIVYVHRDPISAFDGVLHRVRTEGRIVPIDTHMATHENTLPTVEQLKAKFGDKINVEYIDNTGKAGEQKLVTSVDNLPKFSYTNTELRNELLTKLQDAEKNHLTDFTTGVTPEEAAAIRGQTLDRTTTTGQPQTEHTSGSEQEQQALEQSVRERGSANHPPGNDNGSPKDEPLIHYNLQTGKLEKTKDTEQFVHSLQGLQTPEEVKFLIEDMANRAHDSIQEQRRGTISYEQTRKLADTLGMSTEDLEKRKPGKLWNAEQADAANRLMLGVHEHLFELGQKIADMKNEGKGVPDALRLEQAELAMRAQAVTAAVIGDRSEVGRALNAAKMFKEGIDNPTSKALQHVTKIFGGDKNKAKEVMEKLSEFDPHDTLGMIKFIRQITPSTPMGKIEEFWYNSVLSNTATHIVNQMGNAVSTALRIPESAVAGSLDAIGEAAAKSVGIKYNRDRFVHEAAAEVTGIKNGFADGISRATHVMQHGFTHTDVTKFDIGRTQQIGGKVGAVINTPSRMLVAGDELWKGVNYQMDIYAQATRIARQEKLSGKEYADRIAELAANPSGQMMEKAQESARERLFQGESQSANAVRYFRDNLFALNLPVIGQLAPMRFILPFVQTPFNVVKFGLEHSPAGAIATGYKLLNQAPKEEVLDQAAKTLVGSMMMVPLAFFASEGKITGAAPTDPREKDAFFADGKQAWSIKIGDKWYAYNRVEPFNTILAQMAMYHDVYQKDGKQLNVQTLTDFAKDTVANFANQSFMTGLGNLINAEQDPGRYGQKFLTDIIGGFIPSIVAAGARSGDDTIRQPKTIIQSLEQRLPLLNQNVPAKSSAFEPGGVAHNHTNSDIITNILGNFVGEKISKDTGENNQAALNDVRAISKNDKAISADKKANADSFIKDIQAAPDKATKQGILKEYIKNGKMDEQTATYVTSELKKQAQASMPKEELQLIHKSANVRAEYIYTKVQTMDAAHKKEYIKQLIGDKVINNKTADRLSQLLQQHDNLPLVTPRP